MEYLVGAVLTLVSIVFANRMIVKQQKNSKSVPVIRYSQSHVYSLVRDQLNDHYFRALPKTQATEYQERFYTKIVVAEDKAYWIKDNKFYVASVEDGMVDKESSKEVDTMSMDDVELKKIIEIVETLKQGDIGDSRYPRQS